MPPAYQRVLLKLSGEALMGEQQFGIDPAVATQIAKDIHEIQSLGVQTAVVIGGGNLFRGLAAADAGGRLAQLRVLARHRAEFRLASPPDVVQRVLLGAVRLLPGDPRDS